MTDLPSTRIIELFAKSSDPLALTVEERAEIVASLRAQRGAWAEKESTPKAPRGSKTKTPRPSKLTLDMLGDLKL